MKKLTKTLVALFLAIVSTTSVGSGWEITGNVAITTDYLFRGISQTDSDPAIQGGLDAVHESGFYAGIWGSNVDFAGSLELDYYAGFSSFFNEQITYDMGVIYYDYPGGSLGDGVDPEFWETYGGLSYDFVSALLTGKISYSPDYFGETGTGFYYEAGLGIPLPLELDLALHVGYQTIEDGAASDDGFFSSNEDSYADWSIGISKEIGGVGFDVTASGTDLDNDDCFGTDVCDTTIVFTISKTM